jgi:hypothetical protein
MLRRSPVPPRECSSMLLTMPSAAVRARRSFEVAGEQPNRFVYFRTFVLAKRCTAGAVVSFNSSSNSTDRLAKLLTKLAVLIA